MRKTGLSFGIRTYCVWCGVLSRVSDKKKRKEDLPRLSGE